MSSNAEVILFPKNTRRPHQHQRWLDGVERRFQEVLEKQGLNLTRQRHEILHAFFSAEMHLGVEELYDLLKKKDPTLGRATVFRTVKLLQECGRITEFQSPRMEHFQDEAIRKLGFEALWHRHEIFGRCSGCQPKRAARRG